MNGRTRRSRAVPVPTPGAGSRHLRSRFLLLHNPLAGRNRVELPRDVAAALRAQGAVVEERLLAGESSITAAALRSFDALVVSGGDGTVRFVAKQIKDIDIELGIIPNGTGNVLAEELQLPRTAVDIAHALRHGPSIPIAGGEANGELFLLMFGAGFDGTVVAGLSERHKRWLGKLAYAVPIVRALSAKPIMFDAAIDDRMVRASWLVAASASRYGGRFVLTRMTSVIEPGLATVVSRATGRWQRARELLWLIFGAIERAPTIDVSIADHVRILERTPAAHVDGDGLEGADFLIVPRTSCARVITAAASCAP